MIRDRALLTTLLLHAWAFGPGSMSAAAAAAVPVVLSADDESWTDYAVETWPSSNAFSVDRWDRRLAGEMQDILERFQPARLKASDKRVYPEGPSSTVLEFDAEFSGLRPHFRGVVDQERLDPLSFCGAGAIRAHRLVMDLATSERLISRNFTRLEAIICLTNGQGKWALLPRVFARRGPEFNLVTGPTIRGLLHDQVPALMAALAVVWK